MRTFVLSPPKFAMLPPTGNQSLAALVKRRLILITQAEETLEGRTDKLSLKELKALDRERIKVWWAYSRVEIQEQREAIRKNAREWNNAMRAADRLIAKCERQKING